MPYTIFTPDLGNELANMKQQLRELQSSPMQGGVTVCTTATRPTIPYIGQIIFDTTTGKWHGWNGSWSTGSTL